MQRRLPIYLSVIMLLGLLFPMVQQMTGLIYVRPLSGEVPADSTKTDHSWWSGSLQKDLERFSTDSLLLRPACIRLRNQLEFSLAGKLNTQDIYFHKGEFYRYPYVNYSEATEFAGYEKIEQQVQALKALERRLGKRVYVIIAPTKLHYSREELPAWNKTKSKRTNYHVYKQALTREGIAVLDADQWFVQLKRRNHQPPLMAKAGVHWTLYGGALALDSLIKRCSIAHKTDYERVQMQFEPSDKIYPEDVDATNLANLLFPPTEKGLKLVHFPQAEHPKQRLLPLVVSDSYFNVISWTPLHDQVLDPQTAFYYYFHTRFDRANPGGKPIDQQQLREDIRKADCILIISDVQNLSRFGFGFIEDQMKGK